MHDFEEKLRASLEGFVHDIELLMRAAARDALEKTIGASAVRNLGDGLGSVTAPAVKPRTPAHRTRAAARGRKRSPEHLAELTRALDTFIRKNKGLGIEAIGKQLGASTKDLALPVRKLLSERRISARGIKRATRYYPR